MKELCLQGDDSFYLYTIEGAPSADDQKRLDQLFPLQQTDFTPVRLNDFYQPFATALFEAKSGNILTEEALNEIIDFHNEALQIVVGKFIS